MSRCDDGGVYCGDEDSSDDTVWCCCPSGIKKKKVITQNSIGNECAPTNAEATQKKKKEKKPKPDYEGGLF